jgi:hypothetical protein
MLSGKGLGPLQGELFEKGMMAFQMTTQPSA